jgi:hypothetical protein
MISLLTQNRNPAPFSLVSIPLVTMGKIPKATIFIKNGKEQPHPKYMHLSGPLATPIAIQGKVYDEEGFHYAGNNRMGVP